MEKSQIVTHPLTGKEYNINELLDNASDAVRGTVDDMLNEQMPGTENRTREELEAIVRRIHMETIQDYFSGKLGQITAQAATALEWKRIAEELRS